MGLYPNSQAPVTLPLVLIGLPARKRPDSGLSYGPDKGRAGPIRMVQ